MQQNDVPALHITEFGQAPFQRLRKGFALLGWNGKHITYSPDLARLLRSGTKGRRHSSTVNYAYEAAPSHSTTSSARPSTDGGIVRPSVLAVFRLITSSNVVGCSTGKSAGLAPRRILSTYPAARRTKSEILAP